MTTFEKILKKYEGRTNYEGTDKNSLHSYGPVYDRIFEPIRESVGAVLEIGVLSGASLVALEEYFPNAIVYGIDINLSHLRYGIGRPKVVIQKMDGTLPETPTRLGQKFDLIIEDASHLPDHQVKSLDIFADFLNPGGIYIIEDINGASEKSLQTRLKSVADKHGLSMEWLDRRSVKNRYDDILAVFTRKSEDPNSSTAREFET